MSLRLLIGYERPGQRGAAKVIYCGDSGSELDAARSADTTSASFGLINNPVMVRKTNANFQAPPAIQTTSEPATDDERAEHRRRRR